MTYVGEEKEVSKNTNLKDDGVGACWTVGTVTLCRRHWVMGEAKKDVLRMNYRIQLVMHKCHEQIYFPDLSQECCRVIIVYANVCARMLTRLFIWMRVFFMLVVYTS